MVNYKLPVPTSTTPLNALGGVSSYFTNKSKITTNNKTTCKYSTKLEENMTYNLPLNNLLYSSQQIYNVGEKGIPLASLWSPHEEYRSEHPQGFLERCRCMSTELDEWLKDIDCTSIALLKEKAKGQIPNSIIKSLNIYGFNLPQIFDHVGSLCPIISRISRGVSSALSKTYQFSPEPHKDHFIALALLFQKNTRVLINPWLANKLNNLFFNDDGNIMYVLFKPPIEKGTYTVNASLVKRTLISLYSELPPKIVKYKVNLYVTRANSILKAKFRMGTLPYLPPSPWIDDNKCTFGGLFNQFAKLLTTKTSQYSNSNSTKPNQCFQILALNARSLNSKRLSTLKLRLPKVVTTQMSSQ